MIFDLFCVEFTIYNISNNKIYIFTRYISTSHVTKTVSIILSYGSMDCLIEKK